MDRHTADNHVQCLQLRFRSILERTHGRNLRPCGVRSPAQVKVRSSQFLPTTDKKDDRRPSVTKAAKCTDWTDGSFFVTGRAVAVALAGRTFSYQVQNVVTVDDVLRSLPVVTRRRVLQQNATNSVFTPNTKWICFKTTNTSDTVAENFHCCILPDKKDLNTGLGICTLLFPALSLCYQKLVPPVAVSHLPTWSFQQNLRLTSREQLNQT